MRRSRIEIPTRGRGLVNITREIETALSELAVSDGPSLLNIFIHHTSASLVIQENADPTARRDLEEFFDRLVPENQDWHRHLDEGPDDTVSHMKASVLPVSLNLPVEGNKLAIGTWQGVYIFEHRRAPHRRRLTLTLQY